MSRARLTPAARGRVRPGPPGGGALVVALPPEERAAWLAQWWGQARATQEEEVLAQWLVGFLASGLDLATGLDFAVGPGGALETAPTLRVQVLDWLGALAPELAAAEARAVLDRSPSPDEWAVALRDYGRTLGEPSQDDYYLDRVLMLLEQPSWQAGPTRGYLEAFDAAVHSGAEAVVEPLLALSLEAPHPGTRRVATMALDSLAGDDPLLVARVITAPGSPLREMPTFRASLMARLDPREPDHVAELSAYLLTVAEAGEERAAFAGSFPNLNDFAAHYLLTRQPGRNLVEMARTDLAAYELVRQWQTNPAFAARRDTLEAIEARLRPFLESAVRGGFLPAEELE